MRSNWARLTPMRSSTAPAMPSLCASMAARRCSGSISRVRGLRQGLRGGKGLLGLDGQFIEAKGHSVVPPIGFCEGLSPARQQEARPWRQPREAPKKMFIASERPLQPWIGGPIVRQVPMRTCLSHEGTSSLHSPPTIRARSAKLAIHRHGRGGIGSTGHGCATACGHGFLLSNSPAHTERWKSAVPWDPQKAKDIRPRQSPRHSEDAAGRLPQLPVRRRANLVLGEASPA